MQPLSSAAVKQLIGERNIDAAALHRATGGNPFFVTEALGVDNADVSLAPRDAVLARTTRLGPSARAVLDAAAVAGPRVEPWLLEDLTAAESGAVEECLASGVLCSQDGVLVFRHELTREAVLEAMSPTRRPSLHRLVLQALQVHASSEQDLWRLAHHAEGAASEEAVLKFAPDAAREAAAKGAHREAAQQLARA